MSLYKSCLALCILVGPVIASSQSLDLREKISSSPLKSQDLSQAEKALATEAARLRAAESAILKKAMVKNEVNRNAQPDKPVVPQNRPPARKKKAAVSTQTTQVAAQAPSQSASSGQAREIKLLEAAHEEQKRALKIQINSLEKKYKKVLSKLRRYEEENKSLKSKMKTTKSKSSSELQKVDDLQVRLMVAETQVERLNEIIERMGGTSPNMKRTYSGKRTGATIGSTTVIPRSGPTRPAPLYATVTALKMNVRTGPGISNTRVATLDRGEKVIVETKQGNWYRIIMNDGMRAWVSAAGVKITGNNSGSGSTSPREPRLEEVDREALQLLEQLKK